MSSTTANGGSASTLNGTAGMRSTRPSGLGTWGPSTVPMRIAPTVTPTRRPIAAAVRSMPASMSPYWHVGSMSADSSGRVGAPRARP